MPSTNLIFLDEGDEGGPLDLDGLTRSVVEGDDEVEEVGLPQVGGRLLLEVSSSDARSNAETEISKTESRSGFFQFLYNLFVTSSICNLTISYVI